MKKSRFFLVVLLALCATLCVALASCKKKSQDASTDVPVSASSVSLNEASLALTVGGSYTLSATVSPENADDKSVTWSSSDPAVATVSEGNVKAVSAGSATITVSLTANSAVKAECEVTVSAATDPEEPEDPTPTPAVTYTVTFISDGITVNVQELSSGALAERATAAKDGYALLGWYESADFSGSAFDFSTPITSSKTLYAKWQISTLNVTYSQGNYESAAVEWDDVGADLATVEYKLESESDSAYVSVDKELIRQITSTSARVDVLGLKGGERYTIKVVSSAGTEGYVSLKVNSYDRSGYAHYNYTSGVGAYNDDGTLKENAIVIYVTEENKDTVMTSVVEKYSGVEGYEGLEMFNIPYCSSSGVEDKWGGKAAAGIGWWLNNSQYTASNANSNTNKVPSNTYDATNGSKLGFKSVDNPIVIRFIGTVTVPEGCTAYDCEQEGGSNGDNGNMARMRNLKNITLEGVGEDAVLSGWGVHFMRGTDAKGEEGTSFEVRNLTFSEYTEDAVGMEGQQSSGKITASVERCWIHNNTFLPGHCENPAESDKAEGDGSCDFKRGMYFTCSYNWFEYCHKTNLVGSSDSSLQYNLTYHHNVWWQCGSRIPLTRQANVHFYNNYIYGDASESSTPYSWITKPDLSYVHSLRASCYLFSEANYYDGCKNITDGKSGGTGKAWGNMYYSCFGENTLVEASSRAQSVDSDCAYDGVSYENFDTNPQLFYYDEESGQSDCYLTDAVTARKECLTYSGVLKHDYDINCDMTSERPSSALSIPESGLTVDLSQASLGGEVSGVKFINAKNSSGTAKGKGLLCVFTVSERTDITVSGGSTGDAACELVCVDGTVIAGKFTAFTGTLEAGTYFISSGQKDKEGVITALSFKNGSTDEERVQNVITLINAIGEVEYTSTCAQNIEIARLAYNSLSEALKAQVTNYSALTSAELSYNTYAASPVISLIEAIGEVSAESGSKISAARAAYTALTSAQKELVTNYATLTAAEEAYESYEVEGVNSAISALAEASSADSEAAIRSLLAEYNSAKALYEALDETQRTEVTNYAKVTEGIAMLTEALKPYEVRAQIAALPQSDDDTYITKAGELKTAYSALTEAQKAVLTDEEKAAAEAAIAAYDEYASKSVVAIFARDDDNNPLALPDIFTVSGNYKDKATFEYNGTTYSDPLKIESSTTLKFTTTVKMTVTIKLSEGGKKIKIDGTSYTADSDGIITVTLEAGEHTITKADSCYLYYIELVPAE